MKEQKNKEEIVIGLFRKGVSNKEIAEKANISERDIRKYVQNYVNRNEEQKEKTAVRNIRSQAYALYRQNKKPFEVAETLTISAQEALEYFNGYLPLKETDDFLQVYKEWSSDSETRNKFLQMYAFLTSSGYGQEEITNLIRLVNKDLPFLYSQVDKVKENITNISLQLNNVNSFYSKRLQGLKQIEIRTNDVVKINCDMGKELQLLEQNKMAISNLIKGLKKDEVFCGLKRMYEDIVKENMSDIYSIARILIAALLRYLCNEENHDKIMDHVLLLRKNVTIKKVYINGYYIYEPVYYNTQIGNAKGEKDMPLEVRNYIDFLANDVVEIFNLFIQDLKVL